MGIHIQIPDFRTLHYRHSKEDLNYQHLPQDLQDLLRDFIIVLDSTGIKLTNRGDWLSKKHDKERNRGWIKLQGGGYEGD